jgi:hypothetical protein
MLLLLLLSLIPLPMKFCFRAMQIIYYIFQGWDQVVIKCGMVLGSRAVCETRRRIFSIQGMNFGDGTSRYECP